MKVIKATCKKTGKKFALEYENIGGKMTITNFLELTDIQFNTLEGTNPTNELYTSQNLLCCNKCKTRKVASCSCCKDGLIGNNKRICKREDEYNFQCIYCNELEIAEKSSRKRIDDLKIYVTDPHFDNIGAILTSMNIKWNHFNYNFQDIDILFINCGYMFDFRYYDKLVNFVRNGGILYASDWASRCIQEAFPGIIDIDDYNDACHIDANIVDEEIQQVLGRSINVFFDLSAWHRIKRTSGRVLLQTNNYPIMISKQVGRGTIFYTSFHNHSQANDKEKKLLQLLLLKQIGTKVDMSIKDVASLIGLNIKS